jgi:hypothetical protein
MPSAGSCAGTSPADEPSWPVPAGSAEMEKTAVGGLAYGRGMSEASAAGGSTATAAPTVPVVLRASHVLTPVVHEPGVRR